MKRIEINTDMLRKNVSDIDRSIETITGTIKHTYDGMLKLDSMWDGMANEAYKIQFEADYARLLEICGSLKKYADRTDEARIQYEKGEKAAYDIVSGIKI